MKQAGANTRWKLYTAAFAAPVLLLAAVYAAAGFAPFGEKTLLTVDMNGQYVAFFRSFAVFCWAKMTCFTPLARRWAAI